MIEGFDDTCTHSQMDKASCSVAIATENPQREPIFATLDKRDINITHQAVRKFLIEGLKESLNQSLICLKLDFVALISAIISKKFKLKSGSFIELPIII